MRAWTLRALAAATGVVVALLMAEVVLRTFLPAPPVSSIPMAASRPTTSELPDFRRWTPKLERHPGEFRIIVLGDSFTWGWGLPPEHSYVAVLARRLRRLDSELRWDIIPWSRPGWNTREQWISIRDQIGPWNPDLLILGFVLNDAEPTDLKRRKLARFDLLRRAPQGGVAGSLYEHSQLARRLYDAVENHRTRRAMTDYYRSLYRSDGWTDSLKALRKLRKSAQRHGIEFLVVLFPIFDSDLDESYAYRDLHELVGTAMRDAGIRVLDLLPSYQGIDGHELARVPFTDAHPSKLAHRIAAQAILQYLLDERLIPALPAE